MTTTTATMNITAQAAALKRALSIAAPCAKRAKQNPTFSSVRLDADGTALRVSACDHQGVHLQCEVPASGAAGSALIAAKHLGSLVDKIPGGDVTLARVGDANTMRVTFARSRFDLLGLPPDDFIQPQTAGEFADVNVQRVALLSLLDAVLFAASSDETRPAITCVRLWGKDGHLHAVATDGHRLAISRRPCEGATLAPISIPRNAAEDMARVLRDATAEIVSVGVAVGGSWFRLDAGEVVLRSLLVELPYPDHLAVTPDWPKGGRVVVSRDELRTNIGRIVIVARDNGAVPMIKLHAEGRVLVAEGSAAGLGEATAQIDLAEDAMMPVIGVNGRYLDDAIKAVSGDKITIAWLAPDQPVGVWGEDREADLEIVMPMKV